jgi:Protein of unknown function (DUF3306)
MADPEGFARRWSRRKSAARAPAPHSEPEPEPAVPGAAEGPAAASALATEAGTTDPAEPLEPAALPAIETLTYESDFTVFLQPGVPAELRRRALQQLWRSDPVLANLDGLVEYGEDYSRIGIVEEVVRTAYQVGRGMLDRLEPATAEAEREPPPAGAAERDKDGRSDEEVAAAIDGASDDDGRNHA